MRLRLTITLLLFVLVGATVRAAKDIPGLPETINDGKPVEITVFWLPVATDAYEIGQKSVVAVAQEFMRRYPNVKLKPFSFVKVPAAGTGMASDTDILMSMAAGTAPDVLVVNFRQSDSFIRQGFLLPLDEFFEDWEQAPGGKEELKHLIPTDELWKVIKRQGPDRKEHIYSLPPSLYVMSLNYRKDILRNAGERIRAVGLNPEKAPKDWDEFYKMCLQTCDPAQGIYAYPNPSSWHLTWLLWSAGSEILRQDKNNPLEWYADYNDDAAIEGYQFAWKLVNGPWGICPKDGMHFEIDPFTGKGACIHGHTYTAKELKAKKAYFQGVCVPQGAPDAWGVGKQAFNTSYMDDLQVNLSHADPALIGVAQVPMSPQGMSSAELNAGMLALNGTMKDKAKIEAAWAYIRFRSSEVAKRISTKMFVEAGYAKFMNPSWLRRFGYDRYLTDEALEWEKTYQKALHSGHPEPYGKNAQQIYNMMDNTGWGNIKLLPTPDKAKIKAICDTSVAMTNERLIGNIPKPVQKKRDSVAFIVVLASLIIFAFMLKFTLNTYGAALETPGQRSKVAKKRLITAWLIMLPAMAAVILFQYYPLSRGSVIAFQDYQVLTGGKWIGLTNFGSVLYDKEFWLAFTNSLVFAAISLGAGFFAPLILALLLHEVPRGSLFLRIVYFLPSVTSGIVVMLLWKHMYDPSAFGILNQIFTFFHIPQQQFLADPKLVMLWVVVPAIWMGMGPGSIIYLAALRQIPEDYYEAADMDGAGFFAKLKMITIPYLKPLLIINFVGACVGAVKSFDQIMVMTGGGPANKSLVLGLFVFQNAFMYLHYGYATAMGWILASLLIGFTIFQLRYLSKVQFKLAKSD